MLHKECKAIWKDNLAVYHKSLRAFLQAPLQMNTNKLSGKPDKMFGGGGGGVIFDGLASQSGGGAIKTRTISGSIHEPCS